MHVLCVICTHPWMKPAFVDGWESSGARVEVFYYNRGVIRMDFSAKGNAVVQSMNERLLEKARELKNQNELDLIFFSILDDFITVETLVQLRKLDVPLVNYHADMGYLWYRLLRTGKYFDLVCCAQKLYIEEYISRGFKTLYLPFGSNDRLKGKALEEPEPIDHFDGVRYLGSPIVDRPKILAHLHFNGIPLEIYGNHWDWYPREPTPRPEGIQIRKNGFQLPKIGIDEKGSHDTRHYFMARLKAEGIAFLYTLGLKLNEKLFPEVPIGELMYAHIPTWVIRGQYAEDNFAKLVLSCSINVGFTHMQKRQGPHKHLKQIRLRDVEIPMTGGFLLAEACSETQNYFVPGRHLDTWESEDDLLEKVRWYLDHPDECRKIAAEGRRYALEHHTWSHRFSEIKNQLGIR